MFTILNWIFCGIFILIAIFSFVWGIVQDNIKRGIMGVVITILVGIIYMGSVAWYHTSVASGIRYMKDYKSEIENGIEREITITAEDGREIFHYEGKIDIESNHEDNYIKFESEEGKRYIIYYGIQDTIKIVEK